MLRTLAWAPVLQKRFPIADSHEYLFKILEACMFSPKTPGFLESRKPSDRQRFSLTPGIIATMRERRALRVIFFGHIASARLHSVP